MWVGAVLGETAAFLVGRYLFRDGIKTYAKKFRIWRAIELAVEQNGFKLVALLRYAAGNGLLRLRSYGAESQRNIALPPKPASCVPNCDLTYATSMLQQEDVSRLVLAWEISGL